MDGAMSKARFKFEDTRVEIHHKDGTVTDVTDGVQHGMLEFEPGTGDIKHPSIKDMSNVLLDDWTPGTLDLLRDLPEDGLPYLGKTLGKVVRQRFGVGHIRSRKVLMRMRRVLKGQA